jgi:nucleotide-binding universal stress UspA family protein
LEPTESPDQAEPETAEPLTNTGDEPQVLLAAVDTTPAAKRVVSVAARFARAFPAATLHVMHVLRHANWERAHAGAPGMSSDAVADAKDHLDYYKRFASSQCRNAIVGHFCAGNPVAEILRVCAELGVDQLFIATHDHSGFERLLLGSIAETLVRKAPCSVTVVRQPIRDTRGRG